MSGRTRRVALIAFVLPIILVAEAVGQGGPVDLSGQWNWTAHAANGQNYPGTATITHDVAGGTFTWSWIDGWQGSGTVSGSGWTMQGTHPGGYTANWTGTISADGNSMPSSWSQNDGQTGSTTATRVNPLPPPKAYDLIVEANGGVLTVEHCGRACLAFNGGGNSFDGRFSVQNLGPDTLDAGAITTTVAGFGPEAEVAKAEGYVRGRPGLMSCPTPAKNVFGDYLVQCGVPKLASTEIALLDFTGLVRDRLRFEQRLPFSVVYTARVDCDESIETIGGKCENNVSENTLGFVAAPSSAWQRAAAEILAGTAEPPSPPAAQGRERRGSGPASVSGVDVAVLRVGGKLKAFSGAPASEPTPLAAGKGKCLWLKNSKARFAKVAPSGKKCDDPVWVKAKGTKKWSYRLKKPLPAGKYVGYVRATTSEGGVEFFFDNKDGNRLEFRLKP